MAVNLELVKPPAAAPARVDRQEAEARQDRWMLEIERAMFEAGPGKQAAPSPVAERRPDGPHARSEATDRPDAPQARQPRAHRALAHAGAAEIASPRAPQQRRVDGDQPAAAGASDDQLPLQQQGAVIGERPDVEAAPESSRAIGAEHAHQPAGATAPVSPPAQAGSTVSETQPVQTAAPEANGAHGAHGAVVHGAAATAAQLPGRGWATGAASPSIAAGAAAIPAATPLATVHQGGGASVTAPVGAAPVRGPALAALFMEAGVEPALPAEVADVEETEHPHSPSQPQRDGEAQAYAKRLMHVYLAKDGVHAWIRDAELGPAQVRAVVQAISSEFAASGARLAAISVNGKASSASASPEDEDELASAPTEERDVGMPSLSTIRLTARQGDA